MDAGVEGGGAVGRGWRWATAWADGWVPDTLAPDAARRARGLVRMAVLVAPWSVIIGGALTVMGEPVPGAAIGAVGPFCVAVPWLVHRTGRVTLGAHVLVAALVQALVISSCLLGGVASPPTQWIVLGPVIATATGGARVGAWWTGGVVVAALAMHAWQLAGWVEVPYLIDGWVWVGTISAVGLYLLMGLFLRANDALYQRLLERTQAAEAAERRANLAKSAFLASMSHEIRTPLNAVLGYTEMITEDALALGQLAMVDDLGRVRRSGTHLLELVNDILDLSKIEAGRLELVLETVPLRPLVQEVADEISPLVSARNNRLELDLDDVSVRADTARLRQCVFNLLSNAAKFTESGVIAVRARDGRLEVSDTGIGMNPEELARVFEPFSQAQATTARKYGGTGLGMAIVKSLVDLMGGRIDVHTAPGKGSTFAITLPLAA